MLYCIYVAASDRYMKTCCSTNLEEREVTSLYICLGRCCVINGSFICLLASVEFSLYVVATVNQARRKGCHFSLYAVAS